LKILLQTLHSFLDAHPTETIILLLKEEDASNERFSELVYETFKPFLEKRWFLENRIPTLGEVRGRGILMTRFNRSAEGEWAGGMGIHPYTWPDSRREGFVWDCAGTPFRIQDW
jgi:1-phosphatidylinositol phosphodiesterase